MPNDFPVLDGVAPSYADIVVQVSPYGGALVPMKMISAINTGTTVEVGEVRGASGGKIVKRTRGSKSPEAGMTLYREGWTTLLRSLKDLAPVENGRKLISLVHFDVQVVHTPPGNAELFEFHIKGCRVTGRTNNPAEGTDPDMVEVALNTIDIVDIIDGEECVLL